MRVVRPEFVPDAGASREEMEALQRRVAAAATFEDDVGFDPASACGKRADASIADWADDERTTGTDDADADPPIVVGVDQAFLDDAVVSAVVALRGGEVIERTHAVSPLEIPYIPGLLSFREGGPILDAFETLSVDPDLALFDGSGRIHFRQAGLATHMGVALDLPSIGVAKGLLCGTPRGSVDGLPEGAAVAIEADDSLDAPDGTVIGYAVQSRQYDSPNRYVNPLYVSPGHRVSAETARDVVLACRGGYKLPEPTRLADAYADEAKRAVRGE